MSKITELKGVVTKEQLLDQVADYEKAEPLEVELGSNVEFTIKEDGTTSIKHAKGQTSISPTALGTLLSHVGFPQPYLNKIPVEQVSGLVTPHLNYWYQQELAGDIMRLLTIDNNAIVAIPKANFKHIRISEVVAAVESVLGKSVAGYHKAHFSPAAFRFSVLTPEEIKVTDKHTYNTGIRVEHSISGQTTTSVSPYLFNQWCSNGATTEHQLRSWKRRNNKEDIGTWLQRNIIGAQKLFDKEIDNLRQLQNIKIDEHTSEVLDSILEQSSVPRKLQKEVRNTLIDDGAETLYGLYNVLTKTDTHSNLFEEHPSARGILDGVAAHLARHSKLCPVCHKHMNS